MAASPTQTGFRKNAATGRLEIWKAGVMVAQCDATDFGMVGTAATTTLAATTTITAGTGTVVTTGNETNTAGDVRITAGNVRLGAVSAFATTEPTSAVVMKTGTAPVGAITTSSGLFSDGTGVNKIIADGTASAVET